MLYGDVDFIAVVESRSRVRLVSVNLVVFERLVVYYWRSDVEDLLHFMQQKSTQYSLSFNDGVSDPDLLGIDDFDLTIFFLVFLFGEFDDLSWAFRGLFIALSDFTIVNDTH